jgi:hypothetical protein
VAVDGRDGLLDGALLELAGRVVAGFEDKMSGHGGAVGV